MAPRLRLICFMGLLFGTAAAAAAPVAPPAPVVRAPMVALPATIVLHPPARLSPRLCYAALRSRSCLGKLYRPGKICVVGTANCDVKGKLLPAVVR